MTKKAAVKKIILPSSVLVALPAVSKYLSRKEWEVASWNKIVLSPDLLRLIITDYERRNIVMRAAALDRIALGKSYQEIGKELWLSPQTVSGIKKAARELNYKSYLERSKKERKKKIYSANRNDRRSKRADHAGIPRRTKYGTLYM